MPSTYNGFGTAYLGRSGLRERGGVCEACGRFARLRDYRTRKFLVFLYKLPLLPLGAKQILGDCAKCRTHGAVPLKKWKRDGAAAVDEAAAEVDANPASSQAAVRAIDAAAAFLREEDFHAAAPAATEAHPRSWAVHHAAALGFGRFQEHAEAEQAARTALPLAADEEQRLTSLRTAIASRALAGGAEEAAREAEPLRKDPTPADTAVLLIVAEKLAERGDARRATEFLDAALLASPGLAEDADVKRVRKKYAKAQETGKELKPELLAVTPGRARAERPWLPWLGVVGLPVAALAFFTAMSFSAAGSREVFVVSGLNGPSTVEIDGDPVPLLPGLSVPVELAEGTHTVTLILPDGRRIDRGTFEVEGSFFGRVFDGETRVLNPDAVALLWDAPVTYGIASAAEPERLLTPALYQTADGIDYAFEEPPAEITLDAKKKGAVKRELSLADLPAEEAALTLMRQVGPDAAGAWALERLALEPGEAALAGWVNALVEPAEVQARLSPLLAERPVRVNLHRVAQDAEAQRDGEAAVAERYAGLLAEDPSDPDLLYLAARLDPDLARSEERLRRAVAQRPGHPWASLALTHLEMARGELDAAAGHAEAAAEVGGLDLLDAVDWMRGRFDRLRAELPMDPADAPDMPTAFELVLLERLTGGASAAERAAGEAIGSFTFEDPATEAELTELALAEAAYAAGDPEPLIGWVRADDGEEAAFRLAALQGDAGAMRAWLASADPEQVSAAAFLQALTVLADAGEPAADADAVLAAAAAGDPWSERLAAWAGGEGEALPPPVNAWRPELVGYALLRAERDPEGRAALLDLAETLNGDPREPHLLYAAAIDRLRAAPK